MSDDGDWRRRRLATTAIGDGAAQSKSARRGLTVKLHCPSPSKIQSCAHPMVLAPRQKGTYFASSTMSDCIHWWQKAIFSFLCRGFSFPPVPGY